MPRLRMALPRCEQEPEPPVVHDGARLRDRRKDAPVHSSKSFAARLASSALHLKGGAQCSRSRLREDDVPLVIQAEAWVVRHLPCVAVKVPKYAGVAPIKRLLRLASDLGTV